MSVLNILLWTFSKRRLERTRASRSHEAQAWWRRQLLLSAGFVFGCAFRSFLPRADVQRICLYDSWLSCVLIGRAVATVAELCLMTQMALHLRRLGEEFASATALAISRTIVPLIAVAEMCSWSAILTTNYLGNAVEESLWAVSAALLLAGCVAVWPRCDGRTRRLLIVPFIAAPLYLAFMATVDVPMYVSRWRFDQATGHTYLTLIQGLKDVARRCVVTGRREDWRGERTWMSLYFSAAVWISIALATPISGASESPAKPR